MADSKLDSAAAAAVVSQTDTKAMATETSSELPPPTSGITPPPVTAVGEKGATPAAALAEKKPVKVVEEVEECDEFGLPIEKPKPKRISIDEKNTRRSEDKNYRSSVDGKSSAAANRNSFTSGGGALVRTRGYSTGSPGIGGTASKRSSMLGMGSATVEELPKPQISEWSHLALSTKKEEAKVEEVESDGEWQEMPAYASHDIYDDDGRLIAKEAKESDGEAEDGLGGASKGYTRVHDDDDKESVTSMDENTSYLFEGKDGMDDEASKTPLSQMQATKELLTEGQRVAYVGLCRLAMEEMIQEQKKINGGKGKSIKKALGLAVEHTKMWSQKMIHRLYSHMDISPAEQIMIEQLAVHGVLPSDLTPTLMKNARVNNPLNEDDDGPVGRSRANTLSKTERSRSSSIPQAYKKETMDDLPGVRTPSMLPESKTLDIDLRWTILCDLFLVLIADSIYDARSRVLLEKVGKHLEISSLDICKFEKKVTDALEMQENAKQNWSEAEHMENRRKSARNRRYMMMGLATIGGGLVIGLSGGLVAPVIGAGLAAGFTTIGVAGTSTFLTGVGGTAIIASTAVVSGATIGGKASKNRTEHVKTFEYRPLHNGKRVNLIITISGWMSGKEDDVRLPFSTVDPIMGDLFSVLWEPDMLKSMGQTINLLATEVLTQSLQQVLGSTILVALMASIQLPVVLTKLSYLLDNPWSVSLDRATSAGLILADSLISRNLGVRPVTLVGYSLGARVIYSCLAELHKRHAYGLVQNVYLFGSPVVVKKDDYAKVKTAVAGRFVNGYATNDWILGYLFRATSGGIGRVAGLAPIEDIEGVENVNVTDLVDGHMAYRQAIPKLLRRVGWIVVDDEFTEIEDPDPDKHREKQRELMNELDEARRALGKEPTKKASGIFGFFGKSNKDVAKKKDWETYKYEEKTAKPGAASSSTLPPISDDPSIPPPSPRTGLYDDVLFDVDAIRNEISQATNPDSSSRGTTDGKNKAGLYVPSTGSGLRHVKSFDHQSSSSSSSALKIHTSPNLSKPSSHKHNPPSPVKSGFGASSTVQDSYYFSDDEDEFGNIRNKSGDDGNIQMTFGRWDDAPPPQPLKTAPLYAPPAYSSSGGLSISKGGSSSSISNTNSSYYNNNSNHNPPSYSSNNPYSSTAATTTTTSLPKRSSSYNYSASTTMLNTTTTATMGGAAASGFGASSFSAAPVPAPNPWADSTSAGDYYDDYDDENFGVEQEVTMSFG